MNCHVCFWKPNTVPNLLLDSTTAYSSKSSASPGTPLILGETVMMCVQKKEVTSPVCGLSVNINLWFGRKSCFYLKQGGMKGKQWAQPINICICWAITCRPSAVITGWLNMMCCKISENWYTGFIWLAYMTLYDITQILCEPFRLKKERLQQMRTETG